MSKFYTVSLIVEVKDEAAVTTAGAFFDGPVESVPEALHNCIYDHQLGNLEFNDAIEIVGTQVNKHKSKTAAGIALGWSPTFAAA